MICRTGHICIVQSPTMNFIISQFQTWIVQFLWALPIYNTLSVYAKRTCDLIKNDAYFVGQVHSYILTLCTSITLKEPRVYNLKGALWWCPVVGVVLSIIPCEQLLPSFCWWARCIRNNSSAMSGVAPLRDVHLVGAFYLLPLLRSVPCPLRTPCHHSFNNI